MRSPTINDRDRSQWIDNDEGLYCMWRQSRTAKARWIKDNRAMIDACIRNVTEGRKPAHYLRYGG